MMQTNNPISIWARKFETSSAAKEYRPQSENANRAINMNAAATNAAPKKEPAKLATPLEVSLGGFSSVKNGSAQPSDYKG